MTNVDVVAKTGYFQDPYPIHTIAPSGGSGLPTFAGTEPYVISCPGQLQPTCFTPTTVSVDFGSYGVMKSSSISRLQNLNIYQDSTGAWQMAVTAHLNNASADWNVVMHASPTSSSPGVPTAWVLDALLAGNLQSSVGGNDYDGKYFEDSGTLYLVYSATLVRDSQVGIVAQAMVSPSQCQSSSPIPLLGPETLDNGYNSELFNTQNPNTNLQRLKLIETGNIMKIQGKYVMTYSDGGYNYPNYKSGIAWSDTFLPGQDSYYQRVQKIDTAGVWGQPNHAEVQYLLQSLMPQWPNYVGDQVLSPGVPAIFSDSNGNYYLSFAGYDPSDAPTNPSGYVGVNRRPYYIKLQVQIPTGATVSGTSPLSLTSWIQPATTP